MELLAESFPGVYSVTVAGTRVGECLAGFGHELPIIGGWVQCQFEDPIGIGVAHFTVVQQS